MPQAVKKENSGNFSSVKFVGMEPSPLGKQFTVSWFCCIKNHCDLIPRVSSLGGLGFDFYLLYIACVLREREK